jgi:hypothetical protein
MLSSKAEAAFALSEMAGTVAVPEYVKEAIEWIRR